MLRRILTHFLKVLLAARWWSWCCSANAGYSFFLGSNSFSSLNNKIMRKNKALYFESNPQNTLKNCFLNSYGPLQFNLTRFEICSPVFTRPESYCPITCFEFVVLNKTWVWNLKPVGSLLHTYNIQSSILNFYFSKIFRATEIFAQLELFQVQTPLLFLFEFEGKLCSYLQGDTWSRLEFQTGFLHRYLGTMNILTLFVLGTTPVRFVCIRHLPLCATYCAYHSFIRTVPLR